MVDTSDPRDFRRRLERQRDLLDAADIDDRDRDAIERFARRKDGSVSVSTLKTYLRRLRRAAEWADTPFVEMDRDDFEAFVFDLRHDPDRGRGGGGLSDATCKSYEDVCCQFLERECGREWAADIDRTTVETTSVDATAMLAADDIAALREAARHQRDVALVDFLADTGARITLVCSLRVQDVSLDGDRATYSLHTDALGLKGAPRGPFPIIDSAATLRAYLRDTHPRPTEPNAALFHRLRRFDADVEADDGACDPSALRNHLVRLGDRADVEKPTNPHNFRHSAITRMVREGYSREQIEHRVHWALDTDVWERYVHIEAAEHNEDIFAAAGIGDVDDDGPNQQRHPCGNCRQPVAPHHDYCPTCGTAATPERRAVIDAGKESAIDTLDLGDLDAATRRALVVALRAIREDNRRPVDSHD
jgi:integrase